MRAGGTQEPLLNTQGALAVAPRPTYWYPGTSSHPCAKGHQDGRSNQQCPRGIRAREPQKGQAGLRPDWNQTAHWLFQARPVGFLSSPGL